MDVAKDFLQQLAACSQDLTFAYDYNSYSFVYLSDTAKDFFGVEVEEIYKNPQVLIPLLQIEDRQFLLEQINKLKRGEPYLNTEFRLFMPDQTTKWLYAKTYNIFNASSEGTHMVGIIEDITKRKEHEISLYNIKEQKDTVLQILGHDLRAPLNTIAQATELIYKKISEESKEEVKKFLNVITLTSKQALGLINDVLKAEYLETQNIPVKKLRIDLVDSIQNQIDTYQLVRNMKKEFILNPSQEKVYASIDSSRYMLIIENLLSNAYKFTKEDGRIEVTVEERDGIVLIKVSDNGIGIPEKLKPYIFDKFTKARRPGQQGERPVGLGMHIVRTMVEQLEGKIWFESEEGKGTTFFVELPKE